MKNRFAFPLFDMQWLAFRLLMLFQSLFSMIISISHWSWTGLDCIHACQVLIDVIISRSLFGSCSLLGEALF